MPTIPDNDAAGDKTRTKQPDCFAPDSSGMVLVVVIILAAVAAILAAGLHFASGARIKQVRDEVRFEKAFFVAEAGIERAKAELRSNPTNLNVVLFGGDTNYGEGAFYVSAWTNGGTNNVVIIRSTGTVENAMRVIEVAIRLVPPAPYVPAVADGSICFYGTNTSINLKNPQTHVDGNDYNVPADFTDSDGTLSTNPAAPGVYYYSTNTTFTGSGGIDGNPPTTNWAGIYTETYWYQFLNGMLPYATMYTTSDALGTRDAPIITLLPAGVDTKISGNADGAGIVIVPATATLRVSGTLHFEGLIILVGDGVVDVEDELAAAGTFNLFGSMICIGNALNVNLTGNAKMQYSTQALANLSRLALPARLAALDMIYWKEFKVSPTNW